MVVGDRDPPATLGCLTSDRDVATKADQHSAVGDRGDPGGRPVGGQGLGGGPQIETDTRWDQQLGGGRVVLQPPGTGSRPLVVLRREFDRAGVP